MEFEVLTESKPSERRLTQAEVVELAKTERIATPKEADAHVMKKGGAFWTSLWIEAKAGAKTARAWLLHEGEKSAITIPFPPRGYYLPGKFGIPNGKPCKESDPNARYLSRYSNTDYSGLVARWGGWLGYLRRGVYCNDDPSVRLGVLVQKKE